MLEIYDEKVQDLLSGAKDQLQIRELSGSVFVSIIQEDCFVSIQVEVEWIGWGARLIEDSCNELARNDGAAGKGRVATKQGTDGHECSEQSITCHFHDFFGEEWNRWWVSAGRFVSWLWCLFWLKFLKWHWLYGKIAPGRSCWIGAPKENAGRRNPQDGRNTNQWRWVLIFACVERVVNWSIYMIERRCSSSSESKRSWLNA